jgi:hypothetical protein
MSGGDYNAELEMYRFLTIGAGVYGHFNPSKPRTLRESGEFFARSGFFGFCKVHPISKAALLSARDSGLYECDSKQSDSSAVVIN